MKEKRTVRETEKGHFHGGLKNDTCIQKSIDIYWVEDQSRDIKE